MNVLDKVMLTPEAVRLWQAAIERNGHRLRGLKPSEIPDENARVNDDGTLTIYCVLPSGYELSATVAATEWEYVQ